MKKILLTLFMASLFTTMSAVPAQKVWRTYTQSDGTTIELMLRGDENFHFFTTTDGIAVVNEKGSFYYANAMGAVLESSGVLAHSPEMRSASETAAIAQLGSSDANLRRIRSNMPQVTMPRKVGDPSGTFTGSKRGLIILVSFDDLDFQDEDPKAVFTDMVNTVGYTNSFGARGSVHDYFTDQSNGVFDLTFDVVGPYKAPKSVTYYGENKNNSDQHARVIELVKFACESANPEVNFKDYDWDEDGEVDQFYVLYAGKGEASGGENYTIWPHESQIGRWPTAYRLDGVVLNTYACGEEVDYYGQLSGIGTFCHEFSHCLGLPDFYDTNTASSNPNYGMGDWDVMCAGNYNKNSWVPAPYTAYERHFCSWLEYNELTDPCKVSNMAPLVNNGEAFVVYNPANHNEYYLFEHRNNGEGWDRGVSGKGLLIYHVNFIRSRWNENTVNNSNAGNPCMTVVPADNNASLDTENGDLFPYTSTIPIHTYNEFSDETTPADKLFTANSDGSHLLHIKLSKITYTKKSKTVSFTFNDGAQPFVGIHDINLSPSTTSGVYTLNGVRLNVAPEAISTLPRGIYIIKHSDGSTRKVMQK